MSTDHPQPTSFAIPQEGDILAGKYRIERVLGRGGTGVVVAAQHVTLRQRVAVKFLLPETAKSRDMTERFLREARAAAAIQSQHVARVLDVGTLESGAPYMVMELLDGNDLDAVQKHRGPLPITEAVDYVLQACEAIAEAHSIGIIHRDLKPQNLFLTSRADGSPLVKVLDFGLSKANRGASKEESLTAANVIMGSPFYMSPEQIRDVKGVDARTDVWSIGVVLYQLLAGARPFAADSLTALFMIIGADEATPLSEHRPDAPPALSAAVMKCLVKDVAARTQTIAALARSIAPFGSSESQISVERIHRLLGDVTPFVRVASSADLSGSLPALSAGAAAVVLSSVPPPPASEAHEEGEPRPGVKSASLPATTASLTMPWSPRGTSRPPRAPGLSSGAFRAATIGVVALLALGVIGLGAVLRRNAGMHNAETATLTATSSVAATEAEPSRGAAPAALPVKAAEPSPVVTPGSIVPSATEKAAAAPASAAPSASVSARAPKVRAPAPKQSADPFDRWR